MKRSKNIILIALLVLLIGLKGLAFSIPDIDSLGKDPEISRIEPNYLIPGQKVKIFGKNFFETPINANKIFINNYPCRIVSAKKNLLVFTTPNIALQKDAQIKLYTEYLGYKSKEVIFPEESFLKVTFNSPNIFEPIDVSASPGMEIVFKGDFNKKYDLFFHLNNKDIKADILSNTSCKLKLPQDIEIGPFKIYSFYRKHNLDSAPSKEITLFNTSSGKPIFIVIDLFKSVFEMLNENSKYKVMLFFDSGEKKDITEFCDTTSQDESIVQIIKKDNAIESISNGRTNLKAEFIWKPTNLKLDYIVEILVQTPRNPFFNEVAIDEIFPFASGFIKETDANMDGFPKVNEDEFIELKNLKDQRFDLSKCKFIVNEVEKPIFEFEKDSFIEALSRLVIFSNEKNKFNLSNSGAVVDFKCNGSSIDYIAYPTGKSGDPSWQRKDDLSGFIKHPGKLFSPGEAPPVLPSPSPQAPTPISSLPSTSSSSSMSTPTPSSTTTLTPDSTPESNQLIALSVTPDILNFSDRSEKQIQVFAEYSDNTKIEITQDATYKITGTTSVITAEKGLIKPLKNGSVTIEISYQDKSIELSTTVNIKSPVLEKQLIINEVLAAPTSDTNKDSIFKSDQDEFIEIVNVTSSPLDISDLLISDNTRVRHTMPPNTILQGFESIVIFGGGSNSNFSSSIKSQIADTGTIGINNSGQEQITISTQDGLVIDQIVFDNINLQGTSQNRIGDLNFTLFTPHDKLLKSTSKFSPGTRIDGMSFSDPPQDGADQLKSSSSSSGL
jgi:hypothetical protein